jgi:hypothetical protein
MPLNTVDYSPIVDRIAASNADVMELFVPNCAPSIALTKALRAETARTPGDHGDGARLDRRSEPRAI